jgi:hypothetical protein
VARELNDTYNRAQAVIKDLGVKNLSQAVVKVREMTSTIEQLGGQEGITRLRGEVDEYAGELAAFTDGDKSVLDKWAKQAPEGLIKLTPFVMQKCFELNPQAYGAAIAPAIAGTLRNYGLDHSVAQQLANSTDPGAKALGTKLLEMFGELRDVMRQAPKQDDTKANELSQREEALLSKQHNLEVQSVARETLSFQGKQIDRHLAPLLKTKTLSADAKSDLIEGVKPRLERLFAADTVYSSHVKAALDTIRQNVKAGKPVEEQKRSLTRYINAKTEELVPKAVRQTWNVRYGGATQAKGNGNGKVAQKVTAGLLAKQPRIWELDDVPNKQTLFITNRGFIRGKAVHWK